MSRDNKKSYIQVLLKKNHPGFYAPNPYKKYNHSEKETSNEELKPGNENEIEKAIPASSQRKTENDREVYKKRLSEKHNLDTQIQLILGGSTGAVALWCHIEDAMKSGNSAVFLMYVPVFIQKMESIAPLVLKYEAIQSDGGLPEEDPLAVALNWKLDSKELIQRMNNNVEKLRRCSFLDENYVEADQLIQWYQNTFEERNLEYDENGESDSKGDKNCG